MSGSLNRGPGPPFTSEDEFLENFEQTLSVQQKHMSELKEQLLQFEADKKEKAASVKLKADECYQKLMSLKSGANKSKSKVLNENVDSKLLEESVSEKTSKVAAEGIAKEKTCDKPSTPILPPSQKMMLLKQQTEENKRKMAERINNQKGIALKVNKLLEQFDNMQPVFNPVVGMSSELADCSDVDLLRNKIQSLERTISQLNTQLQESRQKENINSLLKSNMSYTELQNELNLDDKSMLEHMNTLLVEKDNEKQDLMNQVFDLQENLKEKDSVIDSKTKAITLMSEDLSKKGKNTVDLLEETKLEMVRMQHNFVQIEANLQEEVNSLKSDLSEKNTKIEELLMQNEQLEKDNHLLQNLDNYNEGESNVDKNEIEKLKFEIEVKDKNIEDLSERNKRLEEQFSILERKLHDYKNNSTNENSNEKIIELEKELELKNKQIENLIECNDRLDIDYKNLQEKFNEYIKSPSEYHEKEITQLKDENKNLSEINLQQEKKINELSADIQLMIIQGSQQSSKSPKKGNKKFKKGQSNVTVDNEQISEMQNRVQLLENELSEYRAYISIKDDENNKLREEIKEIKTHLETKCQEIILLQETITKLEETKDQHNKNEDILKLQQLLDDTTANSKKQIKYLQKQVDSFGKISDAHQTVVNLNQKVFELNNRVAELEEEKGNLQLHLVDYDTNQVPDTEMSSKLVELKSLCQAQINSIALLESQKFDLVQDLHIARQQISSLEDELADLTQTEENVVSSEINNIQLEEKLDSLSKVNEELSQNCDELRKDKTSLEANVIELTKIQVDLTEKLNACICENEEMVKKIDRIERLNAEKVSSAESIEIVENLTHKEKLEIENYEKGLSISEDEPQEIQEQEEDVIISKDVVYDEDDIDLNISVAKLTEESSDLMEKIALFTQERKEVMGRLELLTLENQNLVDRISHLESTSDCKLEEHESLIKDNEKLKVLNEEVIKEKAELLEKLNQLTVDRNILQHDMNTLLNEIEVLKEHGNNTEVSSIQTSYEALLEEHKNSKEVNEMLNQKISELGESFSDVKKNLQITQEEYELHKQTTFKRDCEIKDVIYKMEKEQEKYQQTIEDLNKSNLELMEKLSTMQNQADEDLTNNMLMYKSQVDGLNQEIQRLSNLVKSSEESDKLYKEFSDLKIKFEETERECLNYKQEILNKDLTINALNDQIMELYKQIEHLTNENKDMENEINGLMDEAARNNVKINQLFIDIKNKDTEIEKLLDDLKSKQNEVMQVQDNIKQLQSLQSLDDDKIADLEEVNKKLEAKNKENIEKMKKLAAILKKKSALCVEYETKLNETEKAMEEIKQQDDNKSKEYEINAKTMEIQELNKKVQDLLQANDELKKKESEKSEILNRIKRLEQAIQEKESQNSELLDRINEHKFNYETSLEAIKAKLNEKEVYIESLEIENNSNKEKVSKLIDGLASIEERRRMLEERAEVLDAKLNEKSAVCSEFASNEDLLIKRMKALVDEDAVLEKKLQDLNEQNEQLNINIQDLTKQNHDLISQLNKHEYSLQEYKNVEKSLRNIENENMNLQSQNKQLQSDLRHLNDNIREKEEQHQKQLDEMENDFSSQLQILHNERRASAEELEKLRDCNDSLQDEIVKLKDSLHQLEQNKADLERDITWIKLQNDSMLSVAEEAEGLTKNIDEKAHEIEDLREKLSKAELMLSTNTNIDKPLLERLQEEINQLRDKIHHKDKEIESYQRQNMQLQMAASFGVADEVPFYQSSFNQDDIKIALEEKDNTIKHLQETIKSLEQNISQKSDVEVKQNEQLQQSNNEVPFFQTFFGQTSSNQIEDFIISEQSTKNTELNTVVKEDELRSVRAHENTLFSQNYFNQDQCHQSTQVNQETDKECMEEKVKHLEIILAVKTEHIDELQKLIIKKENEVTALQNGASSLASRMEEMIAAYQYLQNEFEKKQKEVNELIQPKSISADLQKPIDNLEVLNLQKRIEELEQMLEKAKREKEEAIFKIQQLIFDMENLKQQNVQFDIEQKGSFPELVNVYKDVVNVSLPTYTEPGKTEVVEDVIVAKKTYVCHDDEPQEESGWAFDIEDPFLEENQQTSFALPVPNLSIKIETLQNQVKVLEDENVKVNEELKQCQTKLTKSIMKLKEYKNKNIALQDQVKALRTSSDGLDSAIEEVLTLRIEELENELKNIKIESEKNLADKNNLNKRFDALVAANEKIIESKKQQDLELERLNMLVRQLQLQPKHEDPATCITKSESKKIKHSNDFTNNTEIEKLQKVIQEISIDNEELQALLDEQKSSYEEREKKLSKANLDLSFQVDELTKKIQDVREFARASQSEELDSLQKNLQTYQNIILDIIRTYELDSNASEHINVNDSVNTFIKYLAIIEKYVKSLKQNNDEHVKTILENKDLINNLNQQILDKSREIDNLQKEILNINNSRITSYQDETNKAIKQQTMQIEKLQTEHENENYQLQINEMQSIIAMDKSTIAELNRQLLEKSEYVKAIQAQYENIASAHADVQNLHKYINELQSLIDCDKNTISSLQSELFEKAQKIEHLENIDKELSMIKKHNQDLKQEIEGHLKTISDLQNTLSASTTIQADNEFFKTCNNEVLNLQQENLNLKQIIEQNKNVIDDLNTRLFDATSQIERLLHTNITTDKNEDFILKMEQYQKTIALLESELSDKSNKIAQTNFQTNNNEELAKLQKQYDELNVSYINICEDLNNVQSSENRSKRDIDELNKIIQNQQSTIINLEASLSEKSKCIEQLQNENNISANECGGLQQNIDELNAALEQSRSQIENMKLQLVEKIQKIELLEDGKREGNKEFKSKNQELEDKLRACNEQWSQVVEQRCREIADSWKVHLVDVESQFAEKEMALSSQIAELHQQIHKSNVELEKFYSSPKLDDEVALLRVAIEDKQSHVEALTKETEDMRFRLNALEEDNKNKDEKIKLLEKEHSEAQSKSIENANEEIRKLNDILNKQRQDYINLESKFDELSRTYEDFKRQNEIDISSKNINIEGLTKTLAEKCSELDIVSKEIQDLALTLEEERKQMDSMRSALESQELELVTLKEQLGLNADKIVSPLEAVKKLPNQPSTSSVSNPTSANQSELDLAMYMLHQRDMRCEELTMEVMSLLQERDTLQLRLSNALRLNESIRDDVLTENISPSNKETSTTDGPTASNEADQKVKKGATVKKTKDFEMLKNKLSELHALDHSRDLRIFDDRKFRQEQQMALVERDFDKLPQEAKQQLIDADYTLSRDYQGPSTSLLNWLWGKGTKKVDHL